MNIPKNYHAILEETKSLGFTMSSDMLTCQLLKTLAASKPNGKFLELGTGTGLATAWILDGMNSGASLVSIDNKKEFISVAEKHLGADSRLLLACMDGGEWLAKHATEQFDYIFADTWHGKYLMLDETLAMLKEGGFYIIDDMLPQPNWHEGHDQKVEKLMETLANRNDLTITQQNWASGIVIVVKKSGIHN